MEAMVCRAGNRLPSWVASTARVSISSRSARPQACALLAGPHCPQLVVVFPQVHAERNERKRRSLIVFAKGDAHKEAVLDDAATQPMPDMTSPRSEFQTASIPSWMAVSFGAALLVSAAFLPTVSLGPLEFLREGLYMVGSPQLWKSVFYVGAIVHVMEAAVAYYVARRADPQNEVLWFWQTLFLGFFSLSSLLQKSKQKENL